MLTTLVLLSRFFFNSKYLLAFTALCSPFSILASDLIAYEFNSAALARKWSYTVYLPSGYEKSNLRYPVLYLLHGNTGSLNDWAAMGKIQKTADELISALEIPPTLIIMPDADSTWYVDTKEKMETAVMRDLIPEVERRFRVINQRSGRLVAGLSMGGYGALRFSLKYPQMFAAAGLLSPAIYENEPPENSGARRAGAFGSPEFDAKIWQQLNYPALMASYLEKKTPVPMYINSGDDDEFYIEIEAAKLYALLRKNRQSAELRIVNGRHTWDVWESTIGDAMRYLYRYASRPVVEK